MPWMALAIGGSALLGASASKSAASTQAASADRATELQRDMFNKQLELQQPFQEAGVNALNRMQSGNVMGMMDPSYQFRLGEGLKSLDRTAAARGGLISGGALKAAQRYGQEFASNEFGNAYNRLASMAGIGQTATNNMGASAGQFGTNAGNLMTGAGAARASGYVGGANALTGGLNQYMNYTQNQNLMNRLLPQQSTGVAYSNPMYESQMPGAGV
tara:strand:+ start:5305 stop:5952 length:648 start_codon:yes stop_codon:yes gene_type:complete